MKTGTHRISVRVNPRVTGQPRGSFRLAGATAQWHTPPAASNPSRAGEGGEHTIQLSQNPPIQSPGRTRSHQQSQDHCNFKARPQRHISLRIWGLPAKVN